MIIGNKSPMDMNVDISSLDIITCPSCSGRFFTQVHILKRVPKIMIGAPMDIPVSIPVWKCYGCDTILLDFVPRATGILPSDIEDDNEQGV